MSKVAILHGSNDMYGASRVLLDEARVLTSLGHEVTVVVPQDGPLKQMLSGYSVPVVVDPGLSVLRKSRVRDALKIPRLPAAAREADVVVLWTLALAHYSTALRLRRKKFYVAVHELLHGIIGAAIIRCFLRHAKFEMTACSAAVRRWLLGHGIAPERVFITYPIFEPGSQNDFAHRTPPKASLGVVARVNGHKGHQEVAEAFMRVAPPHARLILAGSPFPGQEAHLDHLLNTISNDPRIEYVGQVADLTVLADQLTAVACFPLSPEPFGLVPIEAAMLGMQTLGYDDGGAAEVIAMVGGVGVQREQDNQSVIDDALRSWFSAEDARKRPSSPDTFLDFLSLGSRTSQISQLSVWI